MDKKKEKRKIEFDEIPEHIRERVYTDIGQASVCWNKLEGADVFRSEEAAEIGRSLCQFILEEIDGGGK